MTEQPFVFSVRVYYEDTDATGVVYHANYLRYFERARTEWLSACGVGHDTLAQDERIVFTLSDLRLQFLRPARLGDGLQISVAIGERRRARIVFVQEIRRDGILLIQGQFTVACVNIDSFRPVRLPERLLEEIACT